MNRKFNLPVVGVLCRCNAAVMPYRCCVCKRRGFCPNCGARRMAERAALLIDDVLPHAPMRQWVFTVPFPLRFVENREIKRLFSPTINL